jgi:hypothetical protein
MAIPSDLDIARAAPLKPIAKTHLSISSDPSRKGRRPAASAKKPWPRLCPRPPRFWHLDYPGISTRTQPVKR